MKFKILTDIYSLTLKKDLKSGEEADVPQKIGEAWERKGLAKKVEPSKQSEK